MLSRQSFTWLFQFMTAAAEEWSWKAGRNDARGTTLMKCRRCQPLWYMDRTSLLVLIFIIYRHRHNAPKLIFMLLSMSWGFVTWRNVLLAGGFTYLEQLWESDAIDEDDLAQKWEAVTWFHKGYDTNITLASLHPGGRWHQGLARYLRRLKEGLADEILADLMKFPSTSWSLKVLTTTAGLPPFAALVTVRYLGFWKHALCVENEMREVGLGAKPFADELMGDHIHWPTLNVKDGYSPKRGRNYGSILEASRAVMAKVWKAGPGRFLPEYVDVTLQVIETNKCEARKKKCEEYGSHSLYKSGNADADCGLEYRALIEKFEEIFVDGGQLKPCGDDRISLDVSLPVWNACNQDMHLQTDKQTRKRKRQPQMGDRAAVRARLPIEARKEQMSFLFNGEAYQTLTAFGRICKPRLTRTTHPTRKFLQSFPFEPSMTLVYSGPSLNNVPKKFRKCNCDISEEPEFWAMESQQLDRPCTARLYPVRFLKQLVANHTAQHVHNVSRKLKVVKKRMRRPASAS